MATPSLYAIERPPRELPESGALVLLHGYGAHEADLITIGDMLDPHLRAFGIRAPHELSWGGYAWYSLVHRRGGLDFDEDEMNDSVLQAAEAIEGIASKTGKQPWVLGFSQGGGIALSLALQKPELVRAVFALSPAPVRIPVETVAPKEALSKLPIFAAHGTHDEILPFELGLKTRAMLEEAGCNLEWHEYPMGHEVGNQELRDARDFMKKLG